jgi:hypothetical protein
MANDTTAKAAAERRIVRGSHFVGRGKFSLKMWKKLKIP